MELARSFTTDVREDEALARAGRWFAAAGYSVAVAGSTLRFRRGSRLLTYVAQSPRSWYVTGRLEAASASSGSNIAWSLDLNELKTGQVVTSAERAFFEGEAAGLEHAVRTGEVGIETASAESVARQNWTATIALFALGLVTAAIASASMPLVDAVTAGGIAVVVGWVVAVRLLGAGRRRPR